MKLIDLSSNANIVMMTELLRTVSGLKDPQAVQREFGRQLGPGQNLDGYVGISRRGLPPDQYKITRRMLGRDQFERNDVNPWLSWNDLPTHQGGFIGELISRPEPKLIDQLFLRNDPVFADDLAGFGSAMLTPLFDQGEALNWSLSLRRSPSAFTPADIEEFLMRGNVIGRMTRTLVIQQEIERLNERLQNQLDQIAAIQQSLIPNRLPDIPGLSIAASYLTSNEAGGDYYDFFPLSDGTWGFCVADVSGHGAGAATVVAMMNAILHGSEEKHRGPAAVARHLNQQLSAKRIESNFVTALFGSWDPGERRLRLTNAGHHPPTRRSRTGAMTEIEGGHDIPLGIIDDVGYEETSIILNPADTVVMYTDGITEAFSPPPNREMFGLERLHAALRDCSGEPPCVIESIHEGLYEHTGLRTRDDDQTIVAMRVEDR